MGPKIAIALLLGAIILAAFLEGRSSVPSGESAPSFELKRYEGGSVKLAELEGRLVLVNFWATWCSPCVEEMPYFVRIAEKYEAQGLTFIAVNDDSEETARVDVALFADQTKLDLKRHVAWGDDFVRRAYGVKALPTTVLIGVDGKVIASKRGMVSESWLESQVQEHLPK